MVPSDKKDLYLVFINEHIFPKLVRGPLFLSTTFRTVILDRLPSNMHFIQQIKHSKRNGSDICTFAFSHRLTPLYMRNKPITCNGPSLSLSVSGEKSG